ncbi:hypothetical protein BGX34_007397 [Mortierella sp. NVP85]|nr:hypothetical protein BGX34_007397 [Mortierella sp. NVP85]
MPSKTIDLNSTESTADTTATQDESSTVWYLAYGSNMEPKVFTGRRKIKPIESKVVNVPGYWLSFDIRGIPYLEPCFASILKMDPSRLHDKAYALEVHSRTQHGREFLWDETHPEHPQRSYPPVLQGVAHRITLKDWQMVIQSEGGWGHDVPTGYNQIQVDCKVLDSKESLTAHVLEARPLSIKPFCQPSARYKNLLTSGAAHHHLEPSYQRYLAQIIPYECVGFRRRTARILFSILNVPIVFPFALFVILRSRMQSKSSRLRRPPFWAAWFFDKGARLSNTFHDYFMAPLLGSGQFASEKHNAWLREKIRKELEDGKTTLEEHQLQREAEVEEREGAVLKVAEQAVESVAE